MEGVVTRWKRLTGTEVIKKPVSPIADMDIDGYQEMELVNDFLREFN